MARKPKFDGPIPDHVLYGRHGAQRLGRMLFYARALAFAMYRIKIMLAFLVLIIAWVAYRRPVEGSLESQGLAVVGLAFWIWIIKGSPLPRGKPPEEISIWQNRLRGPTAMRDSAAGRSRPKNPR